jgi:hypothetical protein
VRPQPLAGISYPFTTIFGVEAASNVVKTTEYFVVIAMPSGGS